MRVGSMVLIDFIEYEDKGGVGLDGLELILNMSISLFNFFKIFFKLSFSVLTFSNWCFNSFGSLVSRLILEWICELINTLPVELSMSMLLMEDNLLVLGKCTEEEADAGGIGDADEMVLLLLLLLFLLLLLESFVARLDDFLFFMAVALIFVKLVALVVAGTLVLAAIVVVDVCCGKTFLQIFLVLGLGGNTQFFLVVSLISLERLGICELIEPELLNLGMACELSA